MHPLLFAIFLTFPKVFGFFGIFMVIYPCLFSFADILDRCCVLTIFFLFEIFSVLNHTKVSYPLYFSPESLEARAHNSKIEKWNQ